ncbi:MAG TPA: ATP-binding protein [Chitinophagaceae bacterium]|nr:ATP-binding protein [Chitinophagaceae bacterium]
MSKKIRRRGRDTILQSLRAGVVPNIGLQHIQVGRAEEVKALLEDIDRIRDGGSSIRFIIGEYGSGKTFFLHLIRSIAHEKKLVTVHADLAPDRRVHATGGQARNLYAELMKNMATRSKPNGNALSSVVEKFISTALNESRKSDDTVENIIHSKLEKIKEMVGGYDFADVIASYWEGHDSGNEELKSNAIRWLRAEYTTKTDAKKALGVRTYIDDSSVYDHLKLFAKFVRLAGYEGLLVGIDEMVNLYKLNSGIARRNNYEQILRIVNDSLQGSVEGIGFLMCGTPEFLMDTRKGLYSYEALQTRLAENRFASQAGVRDLSGPIIRLDNLQAEDIYVLLRNIRNVFASGNEKDYLIPDEAIEQFMRHCNEKIGEAYFRTPRNTIRSFVDMLSVLEQNSDIHWEQLIGSVEIEEDQGLNMTDLDEDEVDSDDELSSFEL